MKAEYGDYLAYACANLKTESMNDLAWKSIDWTSRKSRSASRRKKLLKQSKRPVGSPNSCLGTKELRRWERWQERTRLCRSRGSFWYFWKGSDERRLFLLMTPCFGKPLTCMMSGLTFASSALMRCCLDGICIGTTARFNSKDH